MPPPQPENTQWHTGFMLIQGNRLEDLRELMTDWMQRHPLAPLENEVVLVQSNGIGQWLKLALARPPEAGGCGIAAALDVTLPARFIWQTYGHVLEDLPDICAYHKAPMGWRLYRLLGDLEALATHAEAQQQLQPLYGFLNSDDDVRRRHQLAMRLADLFDQYQVYRGDWLDAWHQGEDILIRPDGSHQAVPEAQRWQPLLWRALNQEITAGEDPSMGQSRAQVHAQFLERAQALTQRPLSLPRRVIVFGISSLPRQTLQVLEAMGHLSQVMLFAHNPCQHYWGDIIEGRDLFRQAYRRQRHRKVPEDLDPDHMHLHGHPLLAAWGKQGRDYIRLLDEHDEREAYEEHFDDQNLSIDLFESPGQETLLTQLQDDILELRPLAERRELAQGIDPAQDDSLSFLVAHGPQREVEILHDQLLQTFAQARETGQPLHPRDILVMVPDIDIYAPHIEAVFGRLHRNDPRHIPFNITDQGQRHRNPVLIGLEALLNLPQSRFSVSQILDLLDIPALRARFGINEADLPRLRQWIEGAHIRWGLDETQRADLGLPTGLVHNTWSFGLERMLLGFASDDTGPWRDIEPYDEVAGLEASLMGPLEQLLESLSRTWQALQGNLTPTEWSAVILRLLEDAFLPQDEADTRAMERIHQALDQWLNDCHAAGALEELLPLAVVRDTLLDAIDESTLSQHFMAGSVNFATLMPMRAIPFRQIWLLGMNDGDYPRSQRPADFDLMAHDYRPGDRSRREDDRYLFLEALLSARERLVISWVGRSIRDNAERPASVLVGQLRDHIAAGWHLDTEAAVADGRALVEALTTEHPLQPFSREYFRPGRPARLFTYAHEWQALHDDDSHSVTEAPPTLSPPTLEAPIRLATLGRFLRQPAQHFYEQRLGLWLGDQDTPIVDDETFHLEGLERWQIHQQTLEGLMKHWRQQPDLETPQLLEQAVANLGRAGHLPLPPLQRISQEMLITTLIEPVDSFRSLSQKYAQPCPPREIQLGAQGLELEDLITDLRQDASGACVRLCLTPNHIQKKQGLQWHHLVRHWPHHLAAQIKGPVTTHLLGPDTHLKLPPLTADMARQHLQALLEGYRRGLTELLPVVCKTGFEHLVDAGSGKRPKAPSIYEGGHQSQGEIQDHPVYSRFWPDFDSLMADGRFEEQVRDLYGPLYALMTQSEVHG
ncbi:MAG: exodeoxyribonuclease V subunit gamma [Thioalkalivibrio sp.]